MDAIKFDELRVVQSVEAEGRATAWMRRHRGNPYGAWTSLASPDERGGRNYHVIALVAGEWVRVVWSAGRAEGAKDKKPRSTENYRGMKNNVSGLKKCVDAIV